MRHYLRLIIINSLAFWLAYILVPTIRTDSNYQNIAIIIVGLFIISLFREPLFGLILLPINFLTFGLLSFILNLAFIFILLNFLPGFAISPYNFPGVSFQGIIIQPINLNTITTIITVAAIITISQKALHFIFD